jgi:hypothetical protein
MKMNLAVSILTIHARQQSGFKSRVKNNKYCSMPALIIAKTLTNIDVLSLRINLKLVHDQFLRYRKMFKSNQVLGLLAAVIAIAPAAAIAQEAPNPEPQQQVRQTPDNGSNLLPGVAGAVLNGVTGNKKNIIPGVAGAVLNAVTRKKNPTQNPANIVPGVNEAVNSVTNQQQQDNTPTDNAPPVQQESNNSLPKTHLCNAKAGVEASVQNLNPLNITSGIASGVREILGQKTDSPNKLRANGDLGCLPLPR